MIDDGSIDNERMVVDARGREIMVPAVENIDNIFCIRSCSLQLLSMFESISKTYAIDDEDKLLNSKTYSIVNKNLYDLPKIADDKFESIINLNPDIVISSSAKVSKLNEDQAKLGIPVFGIDADIEFGTEEWFNQIELMGILLGEEVRANQLITGIKSLISDIQSATITGESVKGYACGMMYRGDGTLIKTTSYYLPFDFCGVENIIKSGGENNNQPFNIEKEKLLAYCEDGLQYIFIDGSSFTKTSEEIESFNSDRWKNLDAIVNDNIYKTLVYKIWGTQWVNQLINCFFVAKIVNGDAYDWEFEDKEEEILKLFFGDDVSIDDIRNSYPNGGTGKWK